MKTLTREDAVRRWNEALRVKREAVERETKRLVEKFEQKYGEAPKHVEVW